MAYNPGEELSSLDFSSIIGGSLNAVIVAQAQSSKTSVDFIKEVGFNTDKEGKMDPIFVSFKYPKEIAPAQAAGKDSDGKALEAKPAVYKDMELRVPILTMMPIPFIRIANAEIDLNVKINAVSSTENMTSSKNDVDVDAQAKLKLGPFSAEVKVKASISNQKQSSSSEKIQKDYSLHINVKAVQDEMPAGVSRILDILEESIVTKSLPPAKTAA